MADLDFYNCHKIIYLLMSFFMYSGLVTLSTAAFNSLSSSLRTDFVWGVIEAILSLPRTGDAARSNPGLDCLSALERSLIAVEEKTDVSGSSLVVLFTFIKGTTGLGFDWLLGLFLRISVLPVSAGYFITPNLKRKYMNIN